MSRPIVKNNGVRGPQGDPGPAGPSGTGGLPSGGSDGQVVTKSGSGAIWATSSGLPLGGTTGQALIKNSATNGDAGWADSAAIAPATHAATSKTTLVDADEVPIANSAASYALGKGLMSNVWAYIQTKMNAAGVAKWSTARTIDGVSVDGTANVTVIAPGTHAATAKTVPVANDEIPLVDSAASNVLKKVKVSDLLGNVPTAVDATDAVNKQQLDDATSVLLGSDPLEVAAALPGNIVNVFWDAGASSWHAANYTAQAADPNTGFHFTGGSAAVAPFSVARPLQPWTRAAT